MVGLIDCNNFFVSCERVFKPWLADRPVVVTSNNDGCAVAMSNEAKALGIKRGVPIFQVRDLVRRHNVAVLSGNHKLYGDLSSRVMATLSAMVPEVHTYSIDEAFLDLDLIPVDELVDFGRRVVRKVRRDVGIPTSLGIAPTKTLAKVASRFAKKYPGYHSVCLIDSEEKRRKALELTELTDVWGIGRRIGRRLAEVGITRAIDLADLPESQVKVLLSVPGQRTWRELNAIPCIDHEPEERINQQICTSRTFARNLLTFHELTDCVASYVGIASRKLRRQKACAKSISVFIHTNAYRTDLPQYCNSGCFRFDEPTNDTLLLTDASVKVLRSIFRDGYQYKRAGVIMTDIVDEQAVQQSLFADPAEREKRRRLMKVFDTINNMPGLSDKLHTAAHSCRHTPTLLTFDAGPHSPSTPF